MEDSVSAEDEEDVATGTMSDCRLMLEDDERTPVNGPVVFSIPCAIAFCTSGRLLLTEDPTDAADDAEKTETAEDALDVIHAGRKIQLQPPPQYPFVSHTGTVQMRPPH